MNISFGRWLHKKGRDSLDKVQNSILVKSSIPLTISRKIHKEEILLKSVPSSKVKQKTNVLKRL